jgi:hypothetical protein
VSLHDLQSTSPKYLKDVSNSFKSNVFKPAEPVVYKPSPYRPQDASTEKLFGSDAPDFYQKQQNALLPAPNFQPKEVKNTAWQVKSLDLFGSAYELQPLRTPTEAASQSLAFEKPSKPMGLTTEQKAVYRHDRIKSVEAWVPSNISSSHNFYPTLAQDCTARERRDFQNASNVFPHGRSRTPDVGRLLKHSRSEARQVDLTAQQRKSAEWMSSVFGSPKAYQALKCPELAPEPAAKPHPAIVRQKPKAEPQKEPIRRNVKAKPYSSAVQRNCVPLTPKQMRDMILRTPVVACTPSKLVTLELSGLSPRDDDLSIKQACQGFHLVSVHTSNDQIKGTCQGSAKIQLRVHDDYDSINRLNRRLSEKGWEYSEPGPLGLKSLYIESSNCNFLDSNVEKELLKQSRQTEDSSRLSQRANSVRKQRAKALSPCTELDSKYYVQLQAWERRRRGLSPVEKKFPLRALSMSFSHR